MTGGLFPVAEYAPLGRSGSCGGMGFEGARARVGVEGPVLAAFEQAILEEGTDVLIAIGRATMAWKGYRKE